jgi:hypothetical protein
MNVFMVCRITQCPTESIALYALERGANCVVAKRGSNPVQCTHSDDIKCNTDRYCDSACDRYNAL